MTKKKCTSAMNVIRNFSKPTAWTDTRYQYTMKSERFLVPIVTRNLKIRVLSNITSRRTFVSFEINAFIHFIWVNYSVHQKMFNKVEVIIWMYGNKLILHIFSVVMMYNINLAISLFTFLLLTCSSEYKFLFSDKDLEPK